MNVMDENPACRHHAIVAEDLATLLRNDYEFVGAQS